MKGSRRRRRRRKRSQRRFVSSNTTALSFSPQTSPAPPRLDLMEVQQAEEEDVIGPDGRGSYQHVVALAQALVELRHRRYVTPRQAREVTALWLKLSDWDKAAVTFPPRHQDRLVQGRFRTTQRHAHTPGVDSVKRAVLGKGAGAAQSPDVSRLVEAVLLDLSILHCSEGRTIAGVRIHRWSAVMRDYQTIRENVYSCAALMQAPASSCMRHTKRSKAMMRDTIAIAVPGPSASQTAAEPRLPHGLCCSSLSSQTSPSSTACLRTLLVWLPPSEGRWPRSDTTSSSPAPQLPPPPPPPPPQPPHKPPPVSARTPSVHQCQRRRRPVRQRRGRCHPLHSHSCHCSTSV
ncbi:serine/arginine repetitive matrix protein 1-like [Dicentrarchus labrax]|uniref:serine/arginine repetitive matrix protein 1-like n=1 Tax=Dicentrarchus labrax TaxID=13489 RepID=UPI0021F69893|nr:serine/arginine repetitive matrix protein 1-like [Dicentrarchus labrax]XP_051251505.1 serine/arginine repetitive matrix protein 1-like [Dicentrarchus labrax]